MPAHNTPNSFGLVTRTFHWLTALLILTAIPLGLIADGIAPTPDTIAQKAQLFSLHKTLGVAAFFIGLARILWALTQSHPAPLHPQRRVELTLAQIVHWMLYLSLVMVPLTGWVHHAALDGFAPILWPFGQGLPFVPKSESIATLAGGAHWVFTKLLAASVILHIAGALKHHVIDRDATLARMAFGTAAPEKPLPQTKRFAPLALALVLYGAGTALALSMAPASPAPTVAAPVAATGGNWQVKTGTLEFTVAQMGAPVTGSFSAWTAEITYDEAITSGVAGKVDVSIDLTSLALGSVTDQAKGPEFFDVASHPSARFTADLVAGATGLTAEGTLELHGKTVPISLPFTLAITGDSAQMTGSAKLDRRDFAIGAGYADEATVGFVVEIKVALEATRPN
jgi:cytochrome b561/polyisoprenoid-binding protein YceI